MKKNIVFFSLLCLFSMGVAPSLKANPTSAGTKVASSVDASSTSASWYKTLASKACGAVTTMKSSISSHPYRTIGGLLGVSLLGYLLYKYRTGTLSSADVKAWLISLCPCTGKKVERTAK